MKKLACVIPAYNEEEILKDNILKLHSYFKKNVMGYDWRIIISDNFSTDKTYAISKELSDKHKEISVIHMENRMKSRAIRKVWLSQEADIYMYMDADLSTEIDHIPELLAGIESGSDIVIGSRTSKESKTSRNFNRHIISMGLILLLKTLFSSNITDYQCGFKAINRKVRDQLLPKMRSLDYGFMDTEMLAVASQKGYKIKEIPVIWEDDRKTKASIPGQIFDSLIKMSKIKFSLMTGRYN